MDSSIASYVFQYAGYLAEAALLLYLCWSTRWKKLRGVGLYLVTLLTAELSRALAVYKCGVHSQEYFYVYWSTDLLLVIGAFLLVCLFFRRACRDQEKMWRLIRSLLPSSFILVTAISLFLFTRNYKDLFISNFIFEFNQNLYFTCLVLNTLLYLLLQYVESVDDQLGLLVCGVGIQFAGPAATFALVHLTAATQFAQALNNFIMRLCTLGMILVWAYAVGRVKEKAIKPPRRNIPVLAEVSVDLNV